MLAPKENYYFGNPQLFKMPRKFRVRTPPLTPNHTISEMPSMAVSGLGFDGLSGLGEFKEDSLKKALPFIAGGIALIVGYNIYRSIKK